MESPKQPESPELNVHWDELGRPRMVDVGTKPTTLRRAVAAARLRMKPETRDSIERGMAAKGNVQTISFLAGIQGAKLTSQLIPLCHIVPLDHVRCDWKWLDQEMLEITAEAVATAKTGVEMEALVAASTAALTVYDMCKSIDREMEIVFLGLIEKTGGKSGHFVRSAHRP